MDSGVFAGLAKDFHVIALDLRGHGLSGKPHDSAQYGPEMARDVVRLMDHLSISKAHIVGYSLGSEIIAMLLANDPDRVLSATMGAGVGRLRKRDTDDQHMEEEALEYLKFGVSPKLFLEETPEGTPDPTDEQLRALAAVSLADPGRDRQALAALSRARPSRLVAPEKIATTRMPMLCIAGSLDPELPELNAMKNLRSGVTVTVIDGATHSGPSRALDRKEFLEALRAFLLGQK
jgi:pimeloyl-ACP methyl ester carboxylesterase